MSRLDFCLLWYNKGMDKREPIVSWQAEEYVQNDKNVGWYVGLVVVGLVLVGISVLLRWWSFTALIVVAVFALVVYTVRPPRKLQYMLDDNGLLEGDRLYRYEDFKSFGLLRDGTHFAIVLTPRKRFSAAVTIYFPEEQGEKIVDAFGARLPMEEVKLDFLDRVIKFLRI